MKKIVIFIAGGLLAAYCLVLLFQVFAATDLFLRETMASVSGKNVSVDVCPIFTTEIPKDCSPATDQESAISSLLNAREQSLPPSHPESQKKFFFRIHYTADSGSSIYCLVADKYEGEEEFLFLAHLGPEVNCNEGKFKYLAGTLAIDNFLMRSGDP